VVLFERRFNDIFLNFGGKLILVMALCKLSRGTESNAFAILKDTTHMCLFKFLAWFIEEDISERGLKVL
jgi:hypothetical protein